MKAESSEVNTMKNLATKTLAGRKVTLTKGTNYLATRPMAQRGRRTYPITIRQNTANAFSNNIAELTIAGLSYAEANRFLLAFNNGATSFEGRTW